MQVLGESLAFPVFQRRQLGDQLAAIDGEASDGEHPVAGQPAQEVLPTQMPARIPVRRTTDDHGSPFACFAAMLEARYTATVGTATAVQTQGRNWVAARSGIMKTHRPSTSDVQLWFTEELAAKARPANAARSTNNATT